MKPYFLVISINLWGGGRTLEQALAKLKNPRVRIGGGDEVCVYIFSIEDNTSLENLPYCDMIGPRNGQLPQVKYMADVQILLAKWAMTYNTVLKIQSHA